MTTLKALCFCIALGLMANAFGQGPENRIYKTAVVALTEDPALRADFEREAVVKARGRNYDMITSYDLVPDVSDVGKRAIVERP